MDTANQQDNMKELYSIFHQEYIIMAEYRMLQTENLEGIYVIPSYRSSFEWFGVIFIRSGVFIGGVFRFTINLPDTFPDGKVPTLKFTSQVYHPAVDINSGELNLNEVFPHWDKKQNHIWQILKYLQWIFSNINLKSPANNEASIMFKTNKKLFMEKAKECVILSSEHLYDEPLIEDQHYITFKPYDPKIHDAARNKMLQIKESEDNSHGISWVQSGTYQPFSKDEASQ